MGKTENLIIVSGRIGPLIYYQMNGKQYVRTAPTKVNQPNTEKQQQVKKRFALSSHLASAVYKVMRGWFLESDDPSKRAFNQLKNRILSSGLKLVDTEWVYDFENLLLTEGSLPPLVISVDSDSIKWVLPEKLKPNTTVYLIGIDPESLAVSVSSQSMDRLELSLSRVANYHYYLFYVVLMNMKEKVSLSVKV